MILIIRLNLFELKYFITHSKKWAFPEKMYNMIEDETIDSCDVNE